MEAESMPLDRLPLKRDVISQLLYFFEFHQGVDGFLSHCKFPGMVARAVGYIWTQAGIPCQSPRDIRIRVERLVARVLRNVKKLGQDQDEVAGAEMTLHEAWTPLDPAERRRVAEDALLDELFDVAAADDYESAFYRDQNSERIMRIESLKDRRCGKGEDVYYTLYGKPSGKFSHVLQLSMSEHYQLPQDHLPTELDVVRYIHSRLLLRKNYHSMGTGDLISTPIVRRQAAQAVVSVWKKKNLPMGSLRSIEKRIKRFHDFTKKKQKNGIHNLHRKGLGIDFNKLPQKWRNAAYERYLVDDNDRQAFNLFPRGFSDPSLRWRLEKTPEPRDVALADVDAIHVGGAELEVEDYDDFIAGEERVEEDEWRKGGEREEEEDVGEAMSIAEVNDAATPTNTGKNKVETWTQTSMHVPIDFVFENWPYLL